MLFLCHVKVWCFKKYIFFCFINAGDANRQISDLKFKLAKSDQEVAALEQNVGSRN